MLKGLFFFLCVSMQSFWLSRRLAAKGFKRSVMVCKDASTGVGGNSKQEELEELATVCVSS
jgi:hypothetical protein